MRVHVGDTVSVLMQGARERAAASSPGARLCLPAEDDAVVSAAPLPALPLVGHADTRTSPPPPPPPPPPASRRDGRCHRRRLEASTPAPGRSAAGWSGLAMAQRRRRGDTRRGWRTRRAAVKTSDVFSSRSPGMIWVRVLALWITIQALSACPPGTTLPHTDSLPPPLHHPVDLFICLFAFAWAAAAPQTWWMRRSAGWGWCVASGRWTRPRSPEETNTSPNSRRRTRWSSRWVCPCCCCCCCCCCVHVVYVSVRSWQHKHCSGAGGRKSPGALQAGWRCQVRSEPPVLQSLDWY